MRNNLSHKSLHKNWTMALLFCGLILGAPLSVKARQGGNLGLGLVGGQPTGVSGKYWLSDVNALNFIVGMDLFEDEIHFNADYTWHDFGIFALPQGQLPLYYGMGPWLSLDHKPSVGIRGIVGVDYLFAKAPLDAFFELGPSLEIIPETRFGINLGLGMRYFF